MWNPDPDSDFASQMPYFHGFLALQDMIDNAIIKLQTGVQQPPPVLMQEFPFPCHQADMLVMLLLLEIIC